MFEIVPQEKYTDEDLDYNDKNSRVSKEPDDDEAKRHILLEKLVQITLIVMKMLL